MSNHLLSQSGASCYPDNLIFTIILYKVGISFWNPSSGASANQFILVSYPILTETAGGNTGGLLLLALKSVRIVTLISKGTDPYSVRIIHVIDFNSIYYLAYPCPGVM